MKNAVKEYLKKNVLLILFKFHFGCTNSQVVMVSVLN